MLELARGPVDAPGGPGSSLWEARLASGLHLCQNGYCREFNLTRRFLGRSNSPSPPASLFFLGFVFRSARPSGLARLTLSPMLPAIRPHSVSGSPDGSAASRVRVSAVSTRFEFCSQRSQANRTPHSQSATGSRVRFQKEDDAKRLFQVVRPRTAQSLEPNAGIKSWNKHAAFARTAL